MTKHREPMTYEHTIEVVAALLGKDTVAGICGVTLRSVQYWSEPDCQKQIRMIDAERLDRAYLAAGGDHAPFHRMLSMRLELPDHASVQDDLAACAMAVAKEAGEALAAIVDATAHPEDPHLRRVAVKETQEAMMALQDEVAALRARTQSGGG